jgi:hypothetical protein
MNQGGMKAQFRMDARPALLYTSSAGALVLCLALLLVAKLVPVLISTLAVVLLGLAIAAGLGAALLFWIRRGVRCVEIRDDTLTVSRGRSLSAQAIPRESVAAVRTARRWGTRAAVVLLRSVPPARTRQVQPRLVRIGEEAFPREQFSRFLTVLEAWHRGR